MTTRTVDVLTIQEVVYWLRERLGPSVAWEPFLENCRHGRADLHGLELLPVALMRSELLATGARRGRSRPVYALDDVRTFIAELMRCNPTRFVPGPTQAQSVAIDTSIPWRLNVVGKPVRVSTSTVTVI